MEKLFNESDYTPSDLLNKMMKQTNDEFYYSDGSNDIELLKALKLSNDMKSEIRKISSISRSEIKTLVNLYYQIQDFRKASREQIRAIEQKRSGSQNTSGNIAILDWANSNMAIIEKGLIDTLELICLSSKTGQWLLMIKGIGPVLGAGLLAYYDITKANYATNFLSYGGLNDNNRPWLGKDKAEKIVNEILDNSSSITDQHVLEIASRTQWKYEYLLEKAFNQNKQKWIKKDLINACAKIPYNKELKTHLWKVGSSFQWLCNNPTSLYGRLFSERRVEEINKNEKGEFKDQAEKILATKNIGKSTEAYKCYSEGKLPKAHITARAMRWTEKIFVSHLFEEMYRNEYDKIPPRYYALAKLGNYHNIEIEPEIPYHYVSSEMDSKRSRDEILAEIFEKREKLEAELKLERKQKREAKKVEEAENAAAEEFF